MDILKRLEEIPSFTVLKLVYSDKTFEYILFNRVTDNKVLASGDIAKFSEDYIIDISNVIDFEVI